MHRRARIVLGASLALLVGNAIGCGSDAPAAVARARAPEPEGVRVVLVADHPSDTLAAIHALLPRGRARALVPGTTEDLLDLLVEVPDPALGHIDAEGPVRAVRIVREEDDGATVTAARITGDALALRDGGPAGSRWLGAPGGPDEPAAAVLDGVLVCADRRWALERALAYLVTNAMQTPAGGEGLSLRFGDGVPAQIRPIAEAWIERARERLDASDRRASIDPWLAALRTRVGRLDDVRSAVVNVGAADGALEARITPVLGGALARELEASEPLPTPALAEVPEGTAFAWTESGDDHEPHALGVLGQGLELDESERATLDAARGNWRAAWRGARVEAVGADPRGAWLAAWGPPGAPLDREAIRGALGVPAVARALGAQLECALAPEAWTDVEGGARLPLCAQARLEIGEGEGRRVVALRRGDDLPSTGPLSFDDRSPSRGFSLDGAVWAAIAVPSRAGAAAAIASVDGLAPSGSGSESGPVGADRIMQITLQSSGELRVRARSAAIADLVQALVAMGEHGDAPSD